MKNVLEETELRIYTNIQITEKSVIVDITAMSARASKIYLPVCIK